MPTVQNIIDRAIDRHALNDDQLVSIPTLISFISTEQRSLYLRAARIDPEYFGTTGVTAARSVYTSAWSLDTTPGNVGAITQVNVETVVGTVTGCTSAGKEKISLVGFRWPELGTPPRAYVRGRQIISHGTELGTGNSNLVTVLRLYYSELPAVLTAVGDTISLPDEWQNLLIVPVARMLAIRDSRPEDVAPLDTEYQSAAAAFVDAVLSYSHGVIRPLSQVPAFPMGGGK